MKTIEPLYTERYVQWCGRSATQLMGSLLPDSIFAGIRRKAVSGVGCRSPPANLDFQKIQIGGTYGEIRTKKGIYQKAMVQAVEKYGRFVLQELDCVA